VKEVAMRVLVFGASGRTGRRLVASARARGLPVASFVRTAGSVEGPLHVGDVTHPDEVRAALRPGDVVVSALGGTFGAGPSTAMSAGTRAIVEAMGAVGATRILAVSGAGVLQADATRQRHQLPDYPAQFRAVGAEHQAMHAALSGSTLDWVLVCCPRLLDGDPSGHLLEARDVLPEGTGQVTTGDLASVLLREVLTPTLSRTRIGVNTARP
jgi:putative NADH-flavin reductase